MPAIERPGRVIALQQRHDVWYAQVRLEAAPACSGCGSRGRCATGSEHGQVVSFPVAESVAPGASVVVSLPESVVPLAALLGYFVPVLGLLVGAFFAHWMTPSDLATGAGAVIGLAVGIAAVRLFVTLSEGRRLQPTLCLAASHLPPTGDHP